MSFKKSDVFHVVDTLHNGVVGSWQAFRMGECFLRCKQGCKCNIPSPFQIPSYRVKAVPQSRCRRV